MQVGITLGHLRAGMRHQFLKFVHEDFSGAGKPRGEGMAQTGNSRCGTGAYWNNSGEVMLFLANLSDSKEKSSWQVDLPCGSASGEEELEPLSLKVVKFAVTQK